MDPPSGGVANVSSGWYTNGTILYVSATPDEGYAFSNFALDGTNSSENPIVITLTANHTLDTYFNNIEYYLTVDPTSNGAVNQTSGWYPYGSILGLSALPDPGYTFSNWVIDGATNSSTNPLSITMDMNHTVDACFSVSQNIWVDQFHVVSNNPFDTDPFVSGNGSWVVANPYDTLTFMGSGFVTIQDTAGLPPVGQFQVQDNGSDWQYSVDSSAK